MWRPKKEIFGNFWFEFCDFGKMSEAIGQKEISFFDEKTSADTKTMINVVRALSQSYMVC